MPPFTIAIIGFVALSLLCFVGYYVAGRRARFTGKIRSWKTWLYFLPFAGVMICCGFTGAVASLRTSMGLYFGLQAFALGLGWLAKFAFGKLMAARDEDWVPGDAAAPVLFVLANVIVGMLGFLAVHHFYTGSMISVWFATCLVPFVLPQFLATAFRYYDAIPHEVHKLWYFPFDAEPIDFENVNTDIVYMLELEYSKHANDNRILNTKLRAPIGMNFGDWFRAFLEKYNHNYESDPIHLTSPDQRSFGWIFYLKSGTLGSGRHIDPDLTIAQNKLNDKDVIVARRVGETTEEA